MRAVPDGLSAVIPFPLGAASTAASLGNVGVDVVATVSLILMIEDACYRLIRPYYEVDDATVGSRVCVNHRAPATPDRPIDIAVRMAGIKGRRYGFAVAVDQDGRRVMDGEHERALVSATRFAGVGRAPAPGPEVDFWFDVHSPWCYLASHRIGTVVRRHGGSIRWRPIHLANLSDAIGGRRPLEANSNFAAWYKQDLLDQAELLGLPLRQHPSYPLRPSRALRASLYAAEHGAAEPFVQALMRAYWAEEQDISDPSVLDRLAQALGLTQRPMADVTADPRYKTMLDGNLDEALRRRLFGVPTAVFQDKLFFGNDHLELLDRFLAR
ncbi:MAG: 2-hydroxychromene-2-carboxylate isomerase [Alphaproteobacteria bacterium]|nr:2-hydroxychromene-2-carboxylate isomerase [Alphaproteobacteria bacterium]